ncbi:MAG: hypothetical protein ACQETG_06440 [Thermodesulfobacteriota bacterium]
MMGKQLTKDRGDMLSLVFRDKPETIARPPEWMLPEKQLSAYRRMNDLAIVEIAGRDSVAAAVEASSRNGYGNLLPVYAYTGTEYGSWSNVEEAVNRLTRRLPEIRIHPLLVVGSPAFWRALNGRFIPDLIDTFGHYTPCTGCHLYLHAVRIPLAKMLGNVPVIAGERKSHSGSIKINQVPEAIDFYRRFANTFGVILDLPIADITDDQNITEILETHWKRGKDQPGCVFSGNYKRSTGEVGIRTAELTRFFNNFAGPVAESVISACLENRIPDHEKIARDIMDRCRAGKSSNPS